MVEIFAILFPLFSILFLGFGLARIGFFKSEALVAFNRLVYYVALPAVIIHQVSHAELTGGATLRMFVVFQLGTLAMLVLAYWISGMLGHRGAQRATFVQGSFRANLVYIGLPVLIYAFEHLTPEVRDAHVATAVLVFAPTMITYNVFSVLLYLAGRGELNLGEFGRSLKTLAGNPLILSGVIGIGMAAFGFTMPKPLDLAVEALGRIAVPLALLSIGASLAFVELQGRRRGMVIASTLKLWVLPVMVWVIGWIYGLEEVEFFTVMVFAACPTAAASYVLSNQMGGDDALASGTIALSTVVSIVPLALVLWLF